MKHQWKRKKAQKDFADDWLMTYADMITLLLCFFAVFLFGAVTLNQKLKAEKTPVQISRPDAFAGQETLPPQIAPPVEDKKELPKPPQLSGNLPFYDASQETPDKSDPPATLSSAFDDDLIDVALPELAFDPPSSGYAESPPPVQSPEEQKGDRITVLEMNSAAFFESGSAILNKQGQDVLKTVAEKIASPDFKDYQVTVEGHTDDTPIKTPLFPSNWELSTARASAVVHYFLDQGVPAQRLRAAGYADTFPKVPNHDETGKALPDNQAQNRRVVIKLEKIEQQSQR